MFTGYALLCWLKWIAFFTPLSWFGLVVIRRSVNTRRAEILLPTGVILGMVSYVFSLNGLSFVVKPPVSIFGAYLLLVGLAVYISKKFKVERMDFPKGRSFLIWVANALVWGTFLLYFVAKKVVFGGDVQLYYSIAKTFAKGNFPVVSPWQPDLSVGYHYGGSALLGAVNFLTNLPYDFIHRFSAVIFLFCLVQILIYFLKRHVSVFSYLLYQFIPLIFIFSTGVIMLVVPVFPIELPHINSMRELAAWIINLPGAGISFETWGAPVNISLTVYFLHQFLGLAMFGLNLFVSLQYAKRNRVVAWVVLYVLLAALALTNESIFIPCVFATALIIAARELSFGNFRRVIVPGILLALFLAVTIFLQGGIITDVLLNKDPQLPSSTVIFPKKEDIKGNFTGYHDYQQDSKLFEVRASWKPFRYFHVGFLWLYILSVPALLISIIKFKDRSVLLSGLFAAAVTSTFSYYFIVPRFLFADGNRLMILAYQFLGLFFVLFSIRVIEHLWKLRRLFWFIVCLIVTLWVFGFTNLQPVFDTYRVTLSENTLKPKPNTPPEWEKWIYYNIPVDSRMIVLDSQSPFSETTAKLMEIGGIFAPSFESEYRAYTLESSPKFEDLIYTLNPSLVKEFKISYILIGPGGLENLPDKRKIDINNPDYFTQVYGAESERILRINRAYIENVDELGGTFADLNEEIPQGSSVYIDNWAGVIPWNQLRKSVIFSLKDKNVVFVWGPGVYLNVLADISSRPPKESDRYDYLVLFKDTNPRDICDCKAELDWQGIGGYVKLWKVLEYYDGGSSNDQSRF